MHHDPERERATLSAVFSACSAQLTRVAARFVKSPAVAEEVVQDARLAVWRRLGSCRPANLQAYVVTAVRNVARNWHRREELERRAHERAALEGDGIVSQYTLEAARSPEVQETIEYMRLVIARLPRRVQLTVRMRLYRHMTNAEIAAELGVSEKAIEGNMTRAIHALRDGMRQSSGMRKG